MQHQQPPMSQGLGMDSLPPPPMMSMPPPPPHMSNPIQQSQQPPPPSLQPPPPSMQQPRQQPLQQQPSHASPTHQVNNMASPPPPPSLVQQTPSSTYQSPPQSQPQWAPQTQNSPQQQLPPPPSLMQQPTSPPYQQHQQQAPIQQQPQNQHNHYPQPPIHQSMQSPPMHAGQQPIYQQQHQPHQQPGMAPPPPTMGRPTQQQYNHYQNQQPPQMNHQPQGAQYTPPSPYYPSMHQPGHLAQPQPRAMRLDHKAVPSATDLANREIESYKETDRKLTSTAPATLPPLVTTLESAELKMTQQDGGCVRPCHMRSTIYQVPVTKDILDNSGLEFAVVVKPFDESELDGRVFVPLSENEIVRCNRCKAYINPFSNAGRCCICNYSAQGMQDTERRYELSLGSYEFRVSKEYYRNELAETRRPHIIFAIEATAHSKHLVHYISRNLAEVIKSHFPTDYMYSESYAPLVGFVTYNSKITIYDVLNGGHAYVVSDVSSVTECASTSKFLVDPEENYEAIERFLESLPILCEEQLEMEQQTVLGPVIEAALKTCLYDTSSYIQKPNQKVIPTGKMYVLHSSLPTSGDENTPGRLGQKRNIEDIKRTLGTEAEVKSLRPDGKYYATLAQKCINDYATGIELFLFPMNPKVYLNVATIGDLAHLTGTGVIRKYRASSLDNFLNDLKMSLKSTMGFDASMRVRTSTGISPVKYIGNINTTGSNIEMATVNTTSNFAVQIQYDDKIPENDYVVIQFAMIYTSICGERRVRVHNLALTACQSYPDLYKNACCDTLMNVLVRDTVDKMRQGTLNPKAAKEQLTNKIINILTAYRKYCSEGQTSSSQLILPEGLKLLPVYLSGALKCDAIDGGGEMYVDDKVLAQINLLGAMPSFSQATFYPRLYAIISRGHYELKRCLRIMIDEDPAPCYVLENGHYLFIYFTDADMLNSVFGGREDMMWEHRDRESEVTKSLEELIDRIVEERRRTLTICAFRRGDKMETVFNSFLYEDQKGPGSLSYTDMLCHLHNQIRSKLSQ